MIQGGSPAGSDPEQDLELEEFLDEEKYSGLDVLSMNLRAGKSVAEAVRTTLGPTGMDKLIVDSEGMGMPTNNGASILKEMPVEHPAAKMIVNVAIEQENELNDGTTTSVVFAGALLETAEDLLKQGLHPTTIVNGYDLALQQILDLLEDQAITIDIDNDEDLQRVASTAITGKHAGHAQDTLGALAVEAVDAVTIDGETNVDNVLFETASGGRIEDSNLIDGLVLGRKRAHEEVPFEVEDARIALVGEKIDVEQSEVEMDVSLSDPDELDELLTEERRRLGEKVDSLLTAGADAVISSQHIDDRALSAMIHEGLYVVRNTASSDIDALSKATGASVIQNPADVEQADLAHVDRVGEHFVGGEEKTIVEGSAGQGKSVTLLLRGSTRTVLDEVHRSMEDALHAVSAVIDQQQVLPGGGAVEEEASARLYEYALEVDSREQLVVEAVADAIEVIPAHIAKNAGMESVDAIISLRQEHDNDNIAAGIDAYSGEVKDMVKEGVFDPLTVKRHAFESAIETANLILRIDDLIPTAAEEIEKTGWQGGDLDQELIDYDSRSKSMK